MSAAAETQTERPLYGNWLAHSSAGLKGLGALGTGVALAGFVLTFITFQSGGWHSGLVGLAISLAAVAATTPAARALGRRVGFLSARAKGEHQWRSGVFSRNRHAKTRLPGMLGELELIERDDAFGVHGEPFVVIKNPRVGGLYTVVAKCIADGPWMHDQLDVNAWVSGYSHVLAALGYEQAVVCAKAITDTAPDPGGKLAGMVAAGRAAAAPAVATQVMDEVVADAPSTSSENVTYFEITFYGRGLNRKGNEAAILSELARRVPGIRGRLAEAGGGAVTMVTAAELPAIVRAAYDPAAQPFLEQAALAGHRTTVSWDEAGPVAAQEAWDRYLHDSGKSVTWEMVDAPRAAINERSLTGLLAPSSDFARKRVALIYRPHTPAEAAEVSESDVDSAVFNADQGKKRIKARARLRVKAAERSRDEVALGAGMVRFSMLVTGTVEAGERGDLDQAVSTIEANASAVLMRLRRCYGAQAAGFAATLPIGFVPWEHTVIPDKIREML